MRLCNLKRTKLLPLVQLFQILFFSIKCYFLFLNMEGTPTGLKTRGGSLGPGIVKGRRPIKGNKCIQ